MLRLNRKVALTLAIFGCLVFSVSVEADEIYMLTNPCRLMDTRNIGGMGVGGKLTFSSFPWVIVEVASVADDIENPGLNVQGGESACEIPETATGIVGQLSVLAPESGGHARLWPYGETEPLATSVNAFNGQPETTGIVLRLGVAGQLYMSSSISAAHYVLDVTGYLE